MKKIFLSLVMIGILHKGYSAENPQAFFQNADRFLKNHVQHGLVNYPQIKKNSRELANLIRQLQTFPVAQLENRAAKKAFWLNAYNLLVIYSVMQHYPIKSPLEVPGFFKSEKHRVAGLKLTLDEIENTMLRARYQDARIHFALVCAAKGCPILVPVAYWPGKVEQQLTERTRATLNNPKYVRLDRRTKTVYISELFNWYKTDFLQNHSGIISFINQYRSEKIPQSFKIVYVSYDWSLNEFAK